MVVRYVTPPEVEKKIQEAKEKRFIAQAVENSRNKPPNKNQKKCIVCEKSFSLRAVGKKKRFKTLGFCSKKCMEGKRTIRPALRIKRMTEVLANRFLPKTTVPKEFYLTREWRSLRYTVLKKFDRKCMVCFREGIEIHVDHIKPISKYPELALVFDNLQVLCVDCNMGKGNADCIDWRPRVLKIKKATQNETEEVVGENVCQTCKGTGVVKDIQKKLF